MWAVESHPSIVILSYSEAAMLLRREGSVGIHGLVSVCGLHEQPLEDTGVRHRLVLTFDDVEPPDPSDPLTVYRTWVRQKWASKTGRVQTPPSPADVSRVIQFAETIRDCHGCVLFQCQGGMSRSAAVALICLAAWTGKGQEPYCMEQVIRARPGAVPLLGMVRMPDELLSRDGRLIGAAQDRRHRG